MKKRTHILALLLTMLAALSCTNDMNEVFYEASLSFNPAIIKHTRSNSEGYPLDRPFAVWAYTLPTGKCWAQDSLSADLYLSKEIITYKGGSWQPFMPFIWSSNRLLTVAACSPIEAVTGYTRERGISIYDYDIIADGSDLMFTRTQPDIDNRFNNGCVSLPFISTFTKLEFRVRSTTHHGRNVRLKSIYMDSIAHRGTFHSLPEECWQTTGERVKMEFFSGDKAIEKRFQDLCTCIAMPQQPQQPIKMLIDIYNDAGEKIIADRILTSRLNIESWGVGKHNTYTINIYSDSITFTTEILDNIENL